MPPKPKDEDSHCHIHDEVYDADDIRQNTCVKDLPLIPHSDGNDYCLFHLPTQDKDIDKFKELFYARLDSVSQRAVRNQELPEDEREQAKRDLFYDFRYVWFPMEVTVRDYKFRAYASFRWATFSDGAYFRSAVFFADANFNAATFSNNANFRWATFSAGTYFIESTFSKGANFRSAKFLETSQTFFQQTKIWGKINFQYAVFAGYVAFEGITDECVFLAETKENEAAILDLQNARLEKPERLSFQRVRLCPSWFINVDSREIVFIDISWDNLDAKSRNANITDEIESLKKREVPMPNRLFEIACRHLGVNGEENNRYEEASKFRYMAMETKRLEEVRKYSLSRFITWLYKWTSGYGESWGWAALVLLGVLLFFGLLYATPLARFDYGAKDGRTVSVRWNPLDVVTCGAMENSGVMRSLSVCEGAVHSVYVAALQRPEPKAADTRTRFFIILETIFAPLQAALLALAIRRKFMR